MAFTRSSRKKRICLAYFVVVILSFLVSLGRINPLLFPGDFISFYAAGTLLSEGRGPDLYDVATQARAQSELLAETGRNMNGAVIKFFYPAAFGWIFAPLTALPLLSAYVLWSLLGIAWLIAAVLLVHRGSPSFLPAVPVLALAAMSFFPILECLLQGQSSLFFLFLLSLSYALLQKGRDFSAGLVLGGVFLKPQLPLVLFLLLVLQRKWRVVAGCVGSVAVLIAISVLTIGPDQVRTYLSASSQLLRDPGIRADLMPNLRGTLYRLDSWLGLGSSAATRWWFSVALAVTCLSAFIPGWISRKDRADSVLALRMAQSLLLGLLLTPHLFAYDLALAVMPFLILLAFMHRNSDRQQLLAVILILHTGAFFLNFLVPKTWLEQTLFLGLAAAVWLATRQIRRCSVADPRVMEPQ